MRNVIRDDFVDEFREKIESCIYRGNNYS